jgi:hypothetical protein
MTTPTTPTTTNTPAEAKAPRPLPLYASIPLILACLSAGGWIIHWYVGSRVRADEPHLLGDVPAPAARPAPAAAPGGGRGGRGLNGWLGGGNNRPHVTVRRQDGNGTTYEAGTPRAQALCLINGSGKGRPSHLLSLRYQGGPDNPFKTLPTPVQQTLDNARRLSRDDAAVTALKLTAEQRQKIQELSNGPEMVGSEADKATLLADFKAFASAPQDKPDQQKAAQAKLLADLDAVAERSADASRQQAADHAAKINAIVTPEQWKQFRGTGG